MQEIAEGWEKDERRAEEKLQCINCEVIINEGDICFYVCGKWHGSWSAFDLCSQCGKDAGPFDNYSMD